MGGEGRSAGRRPVTALGPGADPRRRLPLLVAETPPLPGDFWDALEPLLVQLGLADLLAEPARGVIAGHARLLMAWNEAMNLTAIRSPQAVAVAHVADSLTALPLLRERRVDRLIDLGSGPGYPGLPLAAFLPGGGLLVESVGKKARFLAVVVEALGLGERIGVAACRAEELAADPHQRETWPAATARAVGDLAEVLELTFPLLHPGGMAVVWKRRPIEAELEAAQRILPHLGGATLETVEAPPGPLEGHLLVVATKMGPTPAGFPRPPARRRRR
jgi:16S rRNA (guanine527-N7)-methyltransferase